MCCIYFQLKTMYAHTPRFRYSVSHVGPLCDSMWYHDIIHIHIESAAEGDAVSLDPAGFERGSLYIQDSHFKGTTLKGTNMCRHIVVVKYSFLFFSFLLRWCGGFFPLFFLSLRPHC